MPTGIEAGPVESRERIVALDVTRGFALLGILIVNIVFFANPISDPFHYGDNGVDGAIGWIVGFFAQGKFYPLFSLLFGLGFAVQLERAVARNRTLVPTYLRRLLVLLAIGVVHGVFIWAGDILTVYALLGFFLLLVGRGKARWLLVFALVAYVLQVLLVMGMSWSMQAAEQCESAPSSEYCSSEAMRGMMQGFDETQAEMNALQSMARAAYTDGTFAEATAARVEEFSYMLSNMAFFGAQVLGMFLFGAWLGRRGIFTRPREHRRFLHGAVWLGMLAGMPLSAWFATINLGIDYTDMINVDLATAFMINLFAGPLLALAYASAITLGMQTRLARWLSVLAPVGRMALTNYLMQSVVCTLLFYGYGLGLMESRPGMAVLVAIVVAVFVLQVSWSAWWLKRFAFGPAEWLWRAATYLQLPPWRRMA